LREESFRGELLADDDAAERSDDRGTVLTVSFDVDATLVRETLALTATQRIRQNDRTLRMIDELRNGLAKSGNAPRDTGR
jgi:hypothetical protein